MPIKVVVVFHMFPDSSNRVTSLLIYTWMTFLDNKEITIKALKMSAMLGGLKILRD